MVAVIAMLAGCTDPPKMADDRIPLAILGDSDSHSYGDRLLLGPELRGGPEFRATTLQWTEILNRLRGDHIDLGPWGVWGQRYRWVLPRRLLVGSGRYPPKEDFRYNFAISGARCEDLTEGRNQQLPSLLALLRASEGWARGIVVIRIGINSLSEDPQLESYAQHGLNPAAKSEVDGCLAVIQEAVRQILRANEGTRVVVVGILEDISSPLQQGRFESAAEVAGIRAVLDYFDGQLMVLAETSPRIEFIDDRGWWYEHWGGRSADGILESRQVSLGGRIPITNTIGNHPSNAILADEHAGTVVNGLWAKQLIDRLNESFQLGLEPITTIEIAKLVDPDGRLGIAPRNEGTPSD